MAEQAPRHDPVALAHRDSGPIDGSPVVLLHGTGADSTTWSAIRRWPKRWRVMRTDLRGHGCSAWVDSYELPDMADDVRALLDRLELGEVDLVGHSMGAMVAYLFAQRAPERVRRLVLVEPPPPLQAAPPRDEGPRPDGPLSYDWNFQASFTRCRNHPDPSWWEELAKITAPTLILAGQRGSYPAETHDAMARQIPDCEIRFLDSGHHVHEDRPTEFLAALSTFLDQEHDPDEGASFAP